MATDHGPKIRDDEQYEALRKEGMGKEKAARIANSPRTDAASRGGKARAFEDWTKSELLERAQELDIEQRSTMNKAELIQALRNS